MIVTILLVVGILLYTMGLFLFLVFGTFIGLAIWAIGSYYSGGVL